VLHVNHIDRALKRLCDGSSAVDMHDIVDSLRGSHLAKSGKRDEVDGASGFAITVEFFEFEARCVYVLLVSIHGAREVEDDEDQPFSFLVKGREHGGVVQSRCVAATSGLRLKHVECVNI
jgi:hypothetical protein